MKNMRSFPNLNSAISREFVFLSNNASIASSLMTKQEGESNSKCKLLNFSGKKFLLVRSAPH